MISKIQTADRTAQGTVNKPVVAGALAGAAIQGVGLVRHNSNLKVATGAGVYAQQVDNFVRNGQSLKAAKVMGVTSIGLSIAVVAAVFAGLAGGAAHIVKGISARKES